MSLDGFSMHRLVNELRASLLGARIDKITQPNRQTIQLNLRQPGRNHLLYISINSQNPIMYRLRAPLENLPQPPVFCMVLRKYLEAGRVGAIEQNGLDRLVRLDIDWRAYCYPYSRRRIYGKIQQSHPCRRRNYS